MNEVSWVGNVAHDWGGRSAKLEKKIGGRWHCVGFDCGCETANSRWSDLPFPREARNRIFM